MGLLHRGHFPWFAQHSVIHVQQNKCPHGVAVVCLLLVKHSAQLKRASSTSLLLEFDSSCRSSCSSSCTSDAMVAALAAVPIELLLYNSLYHLPWRSGNVPLDTLQSLLALAALAAPVHVVCYLEEQHIDNSTVRWCNIDTLDTLLSVCVRMRESGHRERMHTERVDTYTQREDAHTQKSKMKHFVSAVRSTTMRFHTVSHNNTVTITSQ